MATKMTTLLVAWARIKRNAGSGRLSGLVRAREKKKLAAWLTQGWDLLRRLLAARERPRARGSRRRSAGGWGAVVQSDGGGDVSG